MKTDPHHNPVEKNFSWWFVNIARGLALIPFWSLRGYVGGLAYFFPRLRVLYGKVFLQDRSGDALKHSREIRDCARAEWGRIGFQTTPSCGFAYGTWRVIPVGTRSRERGHARHPEFPRGLGIPEATDNRLSENIGAGLPEIPYRRKGSGNKASSDFPIKGKSAP